MLIVYRKMNGMCNQFQTLAHQIATLLDGNISGKLITCQFEYKEYFPNFIEIPNAVIMNNKRKAKMLEFMYKVLRKIFHNPELFYDYDVYSDDVSGLEKRIYSVGFRRINAFSGWPYYDEKAFYKYRKTIRHYFEIAPCYCEKIGKQINELRQNVDILIGCHIRRGDYKDFIDGKYFYSDEEYAACLKKVISLLEDKKVGVIISTNEKIDLKKMQEQVGNKKVYLSLAQSGIEDVYALSQTDYIVGPPSTFNGWASFYGEVKRFWITPEKMIPNSLDDFIIHF